MGDWSLSPLDISFLAIESEATPMNLGAVMMLDPAPDGGCVPPAAILDLLRARAAAMPRLRRRLQSELLPLGGASWALDPRFDPGRHVRLHHTMGRGGRDERDAWVARMLVALLDRDRPLWQVHVLTGLADGTTAVLMKVHHAFLDGIGTAAAAHALSDDGKPDQLPGPRLGADSALDGPRSLARSILGPLSRVASPTDAARRAIRSASSAVGVAATMTRPGAGLPFDTVVGPQRSFHTASVSLGDLRRLRAVHGGMVNDVLIGAVAGAMRAWLTAHHYPVDGLALRAMIPVASGSPPITGGSGNNFSAVLIRLPVHEADPVTRVRAVCAAMAGHRGSGPHGGPGAVAGLTNLLPAAAVRLAGPLLATQAARLFDVLVTTVPMPRPMRLGGTEFGELYPIAPLAQGQPLGIALATYRGRGFVGITADPVVVPDPAALAAAVPRELDALLAASGLDPAAPEPAVASG